MPMQTNSPLDDTFLRELRQGLQAAFTWPNHRRPHRLERMMREMPEGAEPKDPPPNLNLARLRETVRKV